MGDTEYTLPPLPAPRALYMPEEVADYLDVPANFVRFLGRWNYIPVSAASSGRNLRFARNHLAAISPDKVQNLYAAYQAFREPGVYERAWAGRRGASLMGWVYFVSDGTAVKIGYAINIKERMKALQIGNPRVLTLLAQIEGDTHLERALHRHYAGCKLRNEWFRESAKLFDFITNAPAYELALKQHLATVAELEREYEAA